MARATLTPTGLKGPDASTTNAVADPAGTANVVANGLNIPYTGSAALLLRVSNASGGSGTVSVGAGVQPIAPSSGQGATTVTVATGATTWIGPFESARVSQADGSINVDSSVVMTVTAFAIDGRRSA